MKPIKKKKTKSSKAPKKKKTGQSYQACIDDVKSRMALMWTWYSPEVKKAENRAQVSYKMWACEVCGCLMHKGQIQRDHINPKVPVGVKHNELGFDEYWKNLWVNAEEIQITSLECHSEKPKKEMELRVEARKNPNQ